MQAVIIAAGNSTRTYPLTLTKPKPLLKIINKTLLEHNLSELNGIVDEVIIVIGYKGDMIKERFGNRFNKTKIIYAQQEKQEGTGSATIAVKNLLKNKFIVMNGDDLFSAKDIKKCIKHDYCVLAKKVDDLSRFGEIITENLFVKKIAEKPGKKPGFANTGLYVFTREIFSYDLEKSKRNEYEIVDYVEKLSRDNKKVAYEEVQDFWLPITYPWNLLDANEFLVSKIKKNILGKVEKNVTIKGNVVIGKGTIVKSGTYIEGPAIIGENCSIGPNSYIRAFSTIGNNSKIGNAVEIKNSIVGDNTSIPHLSYIGDSVIGDNVNIAAGTITANLRHDHGNVKSPVKGEMIDTGRKKLGTIIADNVHTGINTSIYPGRKIWPGKTTLPGEIVTKDVE